MNAATLACALCALIVTGLVVRRELMPTSAAAETQSTEVKDWRKLLASGSYVGRKDAALQVVEFADFECPACRAFHKVFGEFQRRHPDDVALVFRQMPLGYHKHAYRAARASLCAGAQGRFPELYNVLYLKQDSLGALSLDDFAERAGVPDRSVFRACAADTARVPAIEADTKVASELGAMGTPTVIMNGQLYHGGPTLEQLESALKSARSKSS